MADFYLLKISLSSPGVRPSRYQLQAAFSISESFSLTLKLFSGSSRCEHSSNLERSRDISSNDVIIMDVTFKSSALCPSQRVARARSRFVLFPVFIEPIADSFYPSIAVFDSSFR